MIVTCRIEVPEIDEQYIRRVRREKDSKLKLLSYVNGSPSHMVLSVEVT